MSEATSENPFAILDTPLDGSGDTGASESAAADSTPAEAQASEPIDAKPEAQSTETPEPAKETADSQPKTGEQVEENEFEVGEDPDTLKKVFKAHPELRTAHFRDQAQQKLMPYQEAKELRQLFPTKEDAAYAAQSTDALHQAVSDFETNPRLFAKNLRETNPQAYTRFVREVAAADLKQIAPDVRLQNTSEDLRTVIDSLKAEAEQAQDQEAWDRAIGLEKRIFGDTAGRKAQQADPQLANLRAENQRLKANNSEQVNRQWVSMNTAIDSQFKSQLEGEARAFVEKLTPSGFSEEAKNRVINEITAKAFDSYHAATANNRAIQPLRREAFRGNPDYPPQKVVAEMMNRARQSIASVGPAALKSWTNIVVGANKTQLNKAAAAGAKPRDIGAVATPAGGPVMPDIKAVNKMSYADLFSSAFK